MKSIKMFSFAALTAMAFVGASSAMAESTALCDGDAGSFPCPAGHLVSHVHETTLSGAKATLLNNISNVLCDVLFLGDTVGTLNNPLVINGTFTYTNCVDEKPNPCTVTEAGGPAEIKVLKEGHETAKATVQVEFKVVCTGISCKYLWQAIGTAKGPLLSSETNGSVSIIDQSPVATQGLLCPGTNKLDITTTPLSPTYISS